MITTPRPRAHSTWPALALGLVAAASACDRPAVGPAPRPGRPPYYLVGERGALSFEDPGSAARADVAAPSAAPLAAPSARKLSPGFGMAIVEERETRGVRLGRTAHGRWIALRNLVRAPGAAATGVPIPSGGRLDFAWVVTPGAPLLAEPSPRSRTLAARPMHARLALRGRCGGADVFCAVDGGWMRADDLRVPSALGRPTGVAPDEIWIDVDRLSNTLLVHEGDRPIFAALVSTGTGRPGTRFATPPGLFRIHAKARAATMDNVEHTGVTPYSYEDIPDVQYITAGVALHAALWHERFGHQMSHGCINAAPADAAHLFALTRPRLAESEDRASATDDRPGTVLRVR